MLKLPWRILPPPPDAATLRPSLVLLASEGRPISEDAVTAAYKLAKPTGAKIKVMSIARIWGSAFGLPHPGLRPTKSEWQAQRDIVEAAITSLEKRGLDVRGEVLGSRNAAKAIIRHADSIGAEAIVMAADAEPHWSLRGLMWSHLPYIVARRSNVPVYLIGPGPEIIAKRSAPAASRR